MPAHDQGRRGNVPEEGSLQHMNSTSMTRRQGWSQPLAGRFCWCGIHFVFVLALVAAAASDHALPAATASSIDGPGVLVDANEEVSKRSRIVARGSSAFRADAREAVVAAASAGTSHLGLRRLEDFIDEPLGDDPYDEPDDEFGGSLGGDFAGSDGEDGGVDDGDAIDSEGGDGGGSDPVDVGEDAADGGGNQTDSNGFRWWAGKVRMHARL
jgi:hypothetical protein